MAKAPKVETVEQKSVGWPADKVERWKIADLRAYARNSRKHTEEQITKIAAAITEWGWTQPILAAEDGTIIAGHARLAAATKLGLVEVPVMVARGWTDEQIRAYVIADNALGDMSEFDDDMLRLELGELKEEGFDLGLTGFDPKLLDDLFAKAEPPEAPDEFKEFGEDIETEHQCPKCGYAWSGKQK